MRRRRHEILALALLLMVGGSGVAAQEPSDQPLRQHGLTPAQAPDQAPGESPSATGRPNPLPQPSPISDDPRSHVLLRLDCESRIDRREVTLFANGTVRLRQGPLGKEAMHLGELGPEEMATTLAQLRQEDLSEVDPDPLTVEGDWVESCLLELDVPKPPKPDPAGDRGRPSMESPPPASRHGPGGRLELRFGRYSSLPLALSRVVQVADRLAVVAGKELPPGLPVGYEPVRGDILERADGDRFQVVGFTADGKGVELEGLDNPLTLYVATADIAHSFVSLVKHATGLGATPDPVPDSARDRKPPEGPP